MRDNPEARERNVAIVGAGLIGRAWAAIFARAGWNVRLNDPHVPTTHKMRNYDLKMHSVPLSGPMLAKYDCVVVATDHAAYDWQMIADNAQLIIDSRNALRAVSGRRDHIVQG